MTLLWYVHVFASALTTWTYSPCCWHTNFTFHHYRICLSARSTHIWRYKEGSFKAAQSSGFQLGILKAESTIPFRLCTQTRAWCDQLHKLLRIHTRKWIHPCWYMKPAHRAGSHVSLCQMMKTIYQKAIIELCISRQMHTIRRIEKNPRRLVVYSLCEKYSAYICTFKWNIVCYVTVNTGTQVLVAVYDVKEIPCSEKSNPIGLQHCGVKTMLNNVKFMNDWGPLGKGRASLKNM